MNIPDQIKAVQARIDAACRRAGRSPDDVTLIAVTKMQPVEAVLEAMSAGLTHFGENRIEEAAGKTAAVRAVDSRPITWHMIGHVQSRKARLVAPVCDVVHSVDSLRLAHRLAEACVSIGKQMPIFLEINISGEESKEGLPAHGWSDDRQLRQTLWQTARDIAALPGLEIRGLMTMAPFYDEAEQTRPIFRDLYLLRDALRAELGLSLPHLSMGMTNDFEVAIEEGATMVRVGRAIFGER
jgi:pyridoxal phosphate enzyme (YggS family)